MIDITIGAILFVSGLAIGYIAGCFWVSYGEEKSTWKKEKDDWDRHDGADGI